MHAPHTLIVFAFCRNFRIWMNIIVRHPRPSHSVISISHAMGPFTDISSFYTIFMSNDADRLSNRTARYKSELSNRWRKQCYKTIMMSHIYYLQSHGWWWSKIQMQCHNRSDYLMPSSTIHDAPGFLSFLNTSRHVASINAILDILLWVKR